MSKKFALKRLTASDLTLFRWHFENRPAGNQKAFNLDSRILVGEFFPLLDEPALIPQPRFNLDLSLNGPGLARSHNLLRKILKQQKNWRLNGEFVENPIDDPERYNILIPGDLALIEFGGDGAPSRVRMQLVAQEHLVDAALFRALEDALGATSMSLIGAPGLLAALDAAAVPLDHPLRDWLESPATLEAAASGEAESLRRVNRRRGGSGMTPEELLRAKEAAEKTGVMGEVLINDYLELERSEGRIKDFEWTSSINAISPFDFKVEVHEGMSHVIDVKSTKGPFSNRIHMSFGEIEQAVHGELEYCILRVYEIADSGAKLRIARNVGISLQPVLSFLSNAPVGISIDSISIVPDLLPFSSEEYFVARPDL